MPARLPDSRQALADYLDDMLHQATTEVSVHSPGEKPGVLWPKDTLNAATGIADESASRLLAEAESEVAPISSEANPACDDSQPQSTSGTLDFPLQCLMFRVGRHLLSVPLVQLSSVVDWNDSITRLPESPGWLLGLVKHRDRNLRIVDSHLLLDIEDGDPQKPGHLLVLDEGEWAITCDRLEQVVNLQADEVQWKSAAISPMVLGTIRQSLATLLNPPGIARELDSRAVPAAN